ncbi:MAG: sigma-70 family RNA polymerase sigma factor [Chloroflexi bacterium]|jgi:RNA polymerase sigma-70 factor (ECF subfamily)|nr:sigma-70 family RNA polymerase sigma factor [Chloroflexota bacterium]
MDLTLIRRSQAGDEGAFAALFDGYKNLVYKTAYLMLDNTDDAEDALQEVFVQVHRSLSTFRPSKGAFTTWLHRITVNHCLNRRRKRRLPTLSLAEVSSTSLADHSPSPEGRLAEEETIQQALGRLSEKQRAVAILRYYWDLSYAEIAQMLDIPVGTVKSRLNLALRTLRKELEAAAEDVPVTSAFHPKEAIR